jgi:hypothetical protein
MPVADTLTERQQKWFASVREGLERETGRSLDDWAELARACPETTPRKRAAWMKSTFGLGQNRAMMVLNAAFPPETGWTKPDTLAETLWADPSARAIHEAVRQLVLALPDVLTGQRKGFTAYSRRLQFCALRPARQRVLLGLALDPATDPLLRPAGKEAWSERLLSLIPLTSPDTPDQLPGWLHAAWERS